MIDKQKIHDVLDAYGGELIASTWADGKGGYSATGLLAQAELQLTPTSGNIGPTSLEFEGAMWEIGSDGMAVDKTLVPGYIPGEMDIQEVYGLTPPQWLGIARANDYALDGERMECVKRYVDGLE